MKKYFSSSINRVFASLTVLLLGSFNTLAFAATTTPSTHPPIIKLRHGTSTNWSGYAAYNSTFNSVSATWTQPSLNCSTNGYSSYWVGLDGYNTSTVEQLGTEGDCSSGNASFYAWYEMYPRPGYYIKNITVSPGDSFSASVTYQGRGNFVLSLKDNTTGKSFSTTQKLNKAQLASAEAIVEAPWSGGVLPLANFGTANFSGSLANGQPLGSFANLDPITMLNPYGMKSTPSTFDSTYKNFSLTWSSH